MNNTTKREFEIIVIRHPEFGFQSNIDPNKHGPENEIKSIEDAQKAIDIACGPRPGMSDRNIKYWAAQRDKYSIWKRKVIETRIG